jgi:hypothetical protein
VDLPVPFLCQKSLLHSSMMRRFSQINPCFCFQLWNSLFVCKSSLSTYTEQPNGFQCFGLSTTLVFVNTSIGFCLFVVTIFGALLIASLAIWMAYDHRFVVMLSGHCLFACINFVLAISCRVQMRCSATLF